MLRTWSRLTPLRAAEALLPMQVILTLSIGLLRPSVYLSPLTSAEAGPVSCLRAPLTYRQVMNVWELLEL
ncbi:MAG TPA: hypothetical protein VFN61_00220, partial [Acidimicrobiales bacterium]|nr:hypothetical protein [Acidimicrobiales bacterium]